MTEERQTSFSLGEIKQREAEKWEFYVDKLIPRRGLTILGGESGVGKSHLLLSMAFAMASQEPALGCLHTEPVKIQLFTEDDIFILKPYVDRIGANFSDPDPDLINFQTSTTTITQMWKSVDEFKPDLIMVDPMMRIASNVRSIDNEAVNSFLDELKYECDRRGCAMIYTRHMRKPLPKESMDEHTAFTRVIGCQAWISNPYHRLVMWEKKGEHFLTSYSKFMSNFHWRISFDKTIGRLVIDKANGSEGVQEGGSRYTDPIFEVFKMFPGAGYTAAEIKQLMEVRNLLGNVQSPALRAELNRLARVNRLQKHGDRYEIPTLIEVVEQDYRTRYADPRSVSTGDLDEDEADGHY